MLGSVGGDGHGGQHVQGEGKEDIGDVQEEIVGSLEDLEGFEYNTKGVRSELDVQKEGDITNTGKI